MEQIRQKRPRLRLSVEEYPLLRNRVLARDGWRCQNCGSSKDLHVHHLVKRSELGDDVEENLITLCTLCHKKIHLGLTD
jgi:5-methylcytosine-specific restriction endonuclease McrA